MTRKKDCSKHIVVPLDGSTLSETALAYVVPLAKRMDAKIVLLHATADPYADMFDSDALRESAEQARQATHDYLRGVAERIRSNGIRCETRTDHGAPAAVILDYAAEQQPDLIAMSTHGRSGLRRLVVGSVTTTILPRAQTPLLVMHPGEDEQPPDYENSLESLIVPPRHVRPLRSRPAACHGARRRARPQRHAANLHPVPIPALHRLCARNVPLPPQT